jgi:uncharacterized protein YbjT (DUF2867 family)
LRIGVTGGTGFVGRRLIAFASEAGHSVQALARRPQPAMGGVTWVAGALDDSDALERLVVGADAIVHVAGVVNAPDRAGFVAGNIDGTRAIVAAAEQAGVQRFVHVSSLAAREPGLSTYGWSKAEGEALVGQSTLDWTIVRPTGVYGPGDTELRDMFRMAKYGLALLPPPGRVSLVAVDDLARLLLTLTATAAAHVLYEVDDGHSYTHDELARMIGAAVGQRVLPLPLPSALLSLGARIDGMVRGKDAKLTADRVGYLCHPDWTADPPKRPPPALWTPSTPTAAGLAATAAWYRANGLL